MNRQSCSLDSLDAVFISSCGRIKSCPKHYFYYTNQGYKLERIKIRVNNESRKILINYIITLKKKLSSYFDILIKQSSQAKASDWEGFNQGTNFCNRIYWILVSKKFVSMKLILSPIEYFLTQPSEKTQEFIDDFKIPEDWSWEQYEKLYRRHIFEYNYFKYEDSKYIHGWAYKLIYNKAWLSSFCFILFLKFMKMSEYEMAFEILQNAISYKEYYGHSSIKTLLKIAETFSKVFESYIKGENSSQSFKRLKEININQAAKNELMLNKSIIWVISAFLRNKVNIKKYLIKAKKFCIKHNYDNNESYLNEELGWWYYENKQYEIAKEYFEKSVNYHKIFTFKNNFIERLIEAYLNLVKAYSGLKKNTEMIEILNEIKTKCNKIEDKFWYFAAIGEIYFLLNDFDQAYCNIWKCINMLKQNEVKTSYELSGLYLYLANIHTWKGDFSKAHQSLATSYSLCNNLLFNDPILKKMYKAYIIFYINSQRYQDALECITRFENNCSEHEILFIKLSLGISYFWMLEFDRASEFLTGLRSNMMNYLPNIYKNELFVVNAYIGEFCRLKGNFDDAHVYFTEAFKLVDYYDIFEIDIFLKSSSFVFNHFLEISDYEKCEIILARVDDILKNYEYMKFRKPYLLTQWSKLYRALHQTEEAEVCLNNAEKLLNIDKILLPCQWNQLNCIGDYIEIAKIYVGLVNFPDEKENKNYLKAEKILKYAERVINTYLKNDLFSKEDIYYWLWLLYHKLLKFDESNYYGQLSLDSHKKYQYNSNKMNTLFIVKTPNS